MVTMRVCAAAGLGLLLLSCGGSGGGGGGGTPPLTGPYAVVADTSVTAGKVAGAVIAGLDYALTDVFWTQTSGPAVTLLSARSQAISFEAAQAGSHQFSVSFRDDTGTTRTQTATVNVTAAASGSQVVARVDHAVRAGGNVSLRAWETLAAGDSSPTFTWTQTDGPTVTLDTSDPRRVLIVAPGVTRDTVLQFRVTMQTALGSDSDTVLVLVEGHTPAPIGAGYVFEGRHVSRVYAYRGVAQGNPYAPVLAGCVYDTGLQWTGSGKNLCTLTTLPLLHQDSGGNLPTVAQVMNRVLVSHDWMGAVFEQFLQQNDATGDIRRLLNGVTAVVIGAQVRPSFYYALTGAIYLDADNFWLTPAQRDVINEAPDFRSDFDRDLGYSGVWRYTVSNANIFLPFPAESRQTTRTVDYLLYETGWLMYHELGHASDFMPVSERATLNAGASAWDNILPRFNAGQLVSDQLTSGAPLLSQQMRGLAQVKFQGVTANATQIGYTPPQVGGFFAGDAASDEYNYSTTREDTAMLFEEFMMARNLGARRDVAITDKITPTTTSSTLIVRWGQRGRAGETQVKPRADFVTQRLAPWVTAADPNAVNNLPAPLAMRAGESWTANLLLPAPVGGVPAAIARTRPLSLDEDAYLLQRAMRRRSHEIPALPGR